MQLWGANPPFDTSKRFFDTPIHYSICPSTFEKTFRLVKRFAKYTKIAILCPHLAKIGEFCLTLVTAPPLRLATASDRKLWTFARKHLCALRARTSSHNIAFSHSAVVRINLLFLVNRNNVKNDELCVTFLWIAYSYVAYIWALVRRVLRTGLVSFFWYATFTDDCSENAY